MATLTLFSSETADGEIESTSGTYSTARAGSGFIVGNVVDSSTVGQQFDSVTFACFESFFLFDLSFTSVGISGASLEFTGVKHTAGSDFDLEVRRRDYGSTLEDTDFVAGASLGGVTPLLGTINTSTITTDVAATFASGQTLIENVLNGFGAPYGILINSSRHRLGNTPGAGSDEYYQPYNSRWTGTTFDPKLILTVPNAASGDILYPEGDVKLGWTTDAAATSPLYTAIDEVSASDSDYVQSPAGPTTSQYYELALQTHTDPLSSTGHIAHYRYQKNISGGAVNLTAQLRQGDGNVLTTDESTLETSISDWGATGNNTSARSTAQAHTGVACIASTGTGGGTSRTALPTGTSGRPVIPSVTYNVSAWFRTAATARTVGIDVRWYDSGGSFISTTTGPTGTDASGSWTQVSGTMTSPGSAAFASVEVNAQGSVLNEVHYIDDIVLSGPIAEWAHTGISNSWTTQNQTLSSAQADSITNYSDLRMRFIPNMTTNDQVPTFVAERASANSNSGVTTVDLVLTSLTVGNYLIIRSSAENSGGGGAARSFTLSNQSGTAMGTHTEYQQNNDPGAASAGVTCNVGVVKIAATSGTIRITYGGTVVQACVADEWSGIDGTTPVVGTPVGANGTASTNLASLTESSIALGNVVYAVEAIEGPSSDTYTQDADSTGGTWSSFNTAKLGTSIATADLNQTVYGGYKAVTAAGSQTYNPTINNARDSAGLILELAAASPTIKTQVSWANFEVPAPPASTQRSGLSIGVDSGFGVF